MLLRSVRIALFAVILPVVTFASDPPWIARSSKGMVAADSVEASQVGAQVLTRGGNAFDAAIATSLALGVTRPQSTGLGGGGFLVAYVAKERRFVVLDFRETAPAVATAERYAKLNAERGNGPSPTVYGGNAVGVPGQMAGLAEIHKRFATRPLRELIEPVVELAETGFLIDAAHAFACQEALADCAKWPLLKEQHRLLYQSLLGGGTPPAAGDRLTRPDLAKGLRLIAEQGPEAVYIGPIAQAIVQAVQAAGGILTLEDLSSYRVRERDALRAPFRSYEIITVPPPSSGGICLVEALNVLDALAQEFSGGLRAIQKDFYPVLLVCALKHAFADRARWLGDPDFARVPVAQLLSRTYADELARRRCPEKSEEYGSSAPPDDRGTSHFCVADSEGNVVALTETINGVFGSLVVAEPYGIILNNEMDDFSANPGKPNLYGLLQAAANAVAPGKRPLSSMTPVIVAKDGRPVLALGGSGGPRIITSVLQVLVNVVEFERPLDYSLAAVRVHHQWQPDEIFLDREPPKELLAALAGRKISAQRRTGIVQAIQLLGDGSFVGGSDPRRGGRPAGVK